MAVLAEDFALVLVHPRPATMQHDRWPALLPEYVVHSYEVQERIADVSGDVAAVLQRVHMIATVAGEERNGVFFISDAVSHLTN